MPILYLKLEEKDLILTKSQLHESGIIYLNHLIFITANKENVPKFQMGKLRLTELTGLAEVQNY